MQPFEGYKLTMPDWNQPPCNAAADMNVDPTMQKYGEQLRKNVSASFDESKTFNSSH